MLIYAIITKINCAAQNALYGGTSLQPLTIEGFVTKKISDLNKENLPIKAALANELLTLALIIVYLIIPDIIKGVTKTEQSIFDVSSLTAATSTFCVVVYSLVIFSSLKEKNLGIKL
jgi:uncharacterized membrane protein